MVSKNLFFRSNVIASSPFSEDRAALPVVLTWVLAVCVSLRIYLCLAPSTVACWPLCRCIVSPFRIIHRCNAVPRLLLLHAKAYTCQTYSHVCGLFYQNVQAISKNSKEWEQHFPKDENIKIEGEQIPYIIRHPQKKPELKAFRPPKETEDELFEGYRRILVVSQPLALLDPMFPALQLIEDFVHFAELVEGVPLHISPYRSDIKELHIRAKDFIRQRDNDFPAFSSFSHIEQMRKRLTAESLTLRHYIDNLIRNLYNDPETKILVKYIRQSEFASIRGRVSLTNSSIRAHSYRLLCWRSQNYGQPFGFSQARRI